MTVVAPDATHTSYNALLSPTKREETQFSLLSHVVIVTTLTLYHHSNLKRARP